MKFACCTIVSDSHVVKGTTMLYSFLSHQPKSNLYLFILNNNELDIKNINVITIEELKKFSQNVILIINKYGLDSDECRWSLKPLIISYLISKDKDYQILYCDSDMFFVKKPTYLLKLLGTAAICLTPHWRPLYPSSGERNFRLNFQDGLFNAGCIAANYKAMHALQWWNEACLYACEANRNEGLWHDQKYLDLMIVYFPDVKICKDISYNVADWNRHFRSEYLEAGGDIEKFEITMIHFTCNTIKRIISGNDPILESYYSIYISFLQNISNQIAAVCQK